VDQTLKKRPLTSAVLALRLELWRLYDHVGRFTRPTVLPRLWRVLDSQTSELYGENSIDQWMVPFFGATVYDDPQVYAKSSPITFIKNAKTPTLVLVGDSDGECPTPQSYEFWHALKTLGVKTELVVYEHEGHMFADAAHQRDVIERVAAWFNQHLK